jgi:nicotinate-nucleotide adenylyltransferase
MTRTDAPARTGLLGGTFNPIHIAHLRAAEEVADLLGLEKVIFIPSATPPHKRPVAGDVMAPAEQRLAWVRLAVAGNPRFAVDDLEIARNGVSYTVETLHTYAERLAPSRPVFLIGQDALVEIATWKEPDTLLGLAHFAVMTRPPLQPRPLAELLPEALGKAFEFDAGGDSARHRTAGTWMRRLPIRAPEVTASDVRARLRSGRSVRYLIPDAAWEAILASRIYAGPETK